MVLYTGICFTLIFAIAFAEHHLSYDDHMDDDHHMDDDDHHMDDDDDDNKEPLTLKEVRHSYKQMELKVTNFSLSIGKSLRAAQDCDVDKMNKVGIYNGLKSITCTFGDFKEVGDEIMETIWDMKERANKQGLPVKLPCMSSGRALREINTDDMGFNEMMMFWQAVKLDAMCVRSNMKNVAKIMTYFSRVEENEDGLRMSIAFGKMKYYLEHMGKVSKYLKEKITYVMQRINLDDKTSEDPML